MIGYLERATITWESAQDLVRECIAQGATRGIAVSVTVVDPALGIIAYGRADGTPPHSAETSRRKAWTSASTKRATGWMSDELAAMLPLGSDNQLTNIRGGFPLQLDGRLLGGLGVAGGTPDQDVEIGTAALAELGAS